MKSLDEYKHTSTRCSIFYLHLLFTSPFCLAILFKRQKLQLRYSLCLCYVLMLNLVTIFYLDEIYDQILFLFLLPPARCLCNSINSEGEGRYRISDFNLGRGRPSSQPDAAVFDSFSRKLQTWQLVSVPSYIVKLKI